MFISINIGVYCPITEKNKPDTKVPVPAEPKPKPKPKPIKKPTLKKPEIIKNTENNQITPSQNIDVLVKELEKKQPLPPSVREIIHELNSRIIFLQKDVDGLQTKIKVTIDENSRLFSELERIKLSYNQLEKKYNASNVEAVKNYEALKLEKQNLEKNEKNLNKITQDQKQTIQHQKQYIGNLEKELSNIKKKLITTEEERQSISDNLHNLLKLYEHLLAWIESLGIIVQQQNR